MNLRKKIEFELLGPDDVKLHFGKYNGKTIKEIVLSFEGMMYLKWVYQEHTRVTEEVRSRIKEIWDKRKESIMEDLKTAKTAELTGYEDDVVVWRTQDLEVSLEEVSADIGTLEQKRKYETRKVGMFSGYEDGSRLADLYGEDLAEDIFFSEEVDQSMDM